MKMLLFGMVLSVAQLNSSSTFTLNVQDAGDSVFDSVVLLDSFRVT